MAKAKIRVRGDASGSSDNKPNKSSKILKNGTKTKGETPIETKIRKYLEIQSKTRLCFVKICRSSIGKYVQRPADETSTIVQQPKTLLAQCTDYETHNGGDNLNNIDTGREGSQSQIEKAFASSCPNRNNNSSTTKGQNHQNSHRVRKCVVKLRRLKQSLIQQCLKHHTIRQERTDLLSTGQLNTADNNDSGCKSLLKTRKCLVKLRKIKQKGRSSLWEDMPIQCRASLMSQILSPNLDKEKRNSFWKLSLSKHNAKSVTACNESSSDSDAKIIHADANEKTESPICRRLRGTKNENSQNPQAVKSDNMSQQQPMDKMGSNKESGRRLRSKIVTVNTRKQLNELIGCNNKGEQPIIPSNPVTVNTSETADLLNRSSSNEGISQDKNDFLSKSTSESCNNLPQLDTGKCERNRLEQNSELHNNGSKQKTDVKTKQITHSNNVEGISDNTKGKRQLKSRQNKINDADKAKKVDDFKTPKVQIKRLRNAKEANAPKQKSDISITNAGLIQSHCITKYFNTASKPHKFFHRQEQKHSPVKPIRPSKARRENVYDFLSQSQTSDSEGGNDKKMKSDPAADIIRKLIAEGKVAVATNRKGKPILKRNKRKPTTQPVDVKRIAKPKKVIDGHVQKKVQIHPNIELEDDDHLYGHEAVNDKDNNDDIQMPVDNVGATKTITSLSGTSKNLARTVLINQAGQKQRQREKARLLLAMAKKYISTPNNKNVPSLRTSMSSYSPIPRPHTKASPWRVDEDAHLPRLFNFSRSSGNLPSFSSDIIPPTPRKSRSNKTHSLQASANKKQTELQGYSMPDIENTSILQCNALAPRRDITNNNDIISKSLSSNDSNAENRTPPLNKSAHGKETNDENANIFNLKQIPNPRRTLNNRSPLKAINIMDVVHLPPINISEFLKRKDKATNKDENGVEQQKCVERPQGIQKPKLSLFGFEDFLSQTEFSSQEDENATCESNNISMQEKRHELRKLKPDVVLPKSTTATNDNRLCKHKYLFNDINTVYAKPHNSIREFLCSTMYHELPTTSKKARKQCAHAHKEESVLFKDIEPETTFNEEDPHRTYISQYKRKRRLREDRLVMYYDSDESDCANNSPVKKNHSNKSRETDTSSEMPNKRKRRRKKDDPNLQHFVNDFKAMCNEVENYDLIIEKSA